MRGRFEKYYLYLTVFVTGAVILIIEILGTRIIAPYYGSTIYVWSSLIGVTLLSLTAGYFTGGLVSDRRPEKNLMFIIISGSALSIMIIPLISVPVLKSTNFMGIKFGALASSAILFALPLGLLGMVTPYAVRLSAKQVSSIGITSGSLYGVSTIGSFVGAISTGFYLIPFLGIKAIINICGFSLLFIALVWFILNNKRVLPVIISVILLSGIASAINIKPPVYKSKKIRMVHEAETMYSRVRVFDIKDTRYFMANGAVQNFYNLNKESFDIEYLKMFKEGFDAHPSPREILIVGLGAGGMDTVLKGAGANIDFVEIDPAVLKIAKKYFGFSGNYTINDGRAYIRGTEKKYDMVFLDAFTGYTVYPYILTKEALKEIKAKMNNNGMVVLNIVDRYDRRQMIVTKLAASLKKTLKTVFNNVYISADDNWPLASLIYYASDSEFKIESKYNFKLFGNTLL